MQRSLPLCPSASPCPHTVAMPAALCGVTPALPVELRGPARRTEEWCPCRYFTSHGKTMIFFMEVSFPMISVWLTHFSELSCLAQPTASQGCALLVPTLKARHWEPGKGKSREAGYVSCPLCPFYCSIGYHRFPPGKFQAAWVPFAPSSADVGSRAAGCQRELVFNKVPGVPRLEAGARQGTGSCSAQPQLQWAQLNIQREQVWNKFHCYQGSLRKGLRSA